MARYDDIIGAVRPLLASYDFKPTIRQIYYRLVSPPYQLIPNTKSAYTGFDKQMVRARERSELPSDAFADTSRQLLGGDDGFDSPEAFLAGLRQYLAPSNYTGQMWGSQPTQVEVWVEKDALAQVVLRATEPYRVLVYPSRGYSPFTRLAEAVARFEQKPAILLDLRDLDPSGLDMSRDIQERLARYGGQFQYVRLALNENQVEGLPPNPTKRDDTRGGAYMARLGDRCWELDALPPDGLQRLITEAIEARIDWAAWQTTLGRIEAERQTLDPILARARQVLASQ